jgi:2-methylcitrate dehydratase PrpD
MTVSLTKTLGAFVAGNNIDDIPASVIERTTISLIHNFTIAMAGRTRETVCHSMAKHFWKIPSEATLLHDGTQVCLEAAAFANGALMYARSPGRYPRRLKTSHPGTPVIPVGTIRP